jgi:hypothetical protein
MRILAWRLLYWLIGTRAVAAVLAASVHAVRGLRGEAAASRWLTHYAHLLVSIGWPRRTRGWINVHLSQLFWRVRLRVEDVASPPRRRPALPNGRLRIGCLGAFSGLLSFQRRLFEARPAGTEIFVFDLQYSGQFAEYLSPLVEGYHPIPTQRDANHDSLAVAARTINEAQLDVLINVHAKSEAHDVLSRIDTPCVVNISTSSDVLHHPKISFQILAQIEADYFSTGNRLFCGMNRRELQEQVVYPGWILYDPRDLPVGGPPADWAARTPLVMFHGSLYKLDAPAFLEALFSLLRDDRQLDFVFMGRHTGPALEAILRRAREHGVAGQVHYEGAYAVLRHPVSGEVDAEGWSKAVSYLRRARLAPNPWPVGGASARFEAYLAGAPTAHLALRTDRAGWGRRQHTLVDVPALEVPSATAATPQQYLTICRRNLYEPEFASLVAAEQMRVAAAVSNPVRYWEQILNRYRDWLAETAGIELPPLAPALQPVSYG